MVENDFDVSVCDSLGDPTENFKILILYVFVSFLDDSNSGNGILR